MRDKLKQDLKGYKTTYREEEKYLDDFLDLLSHPECFYRHHQPGHITASAFVINQDRSKVLLVHHAKLNRWLQPGGHADGDEDTRNVALKEVREETGLAKVSYQSDLFFDIDIHRIPAGSDMQEHFHYDIRYLFEADSEDEIVTSEESHDVRWIDLDNLEKYTSESSIFRMKEKMSRLLL